MTVVFVIYYGVLMFAGGVAVGGAIWTIRHHRDLSDLSDIPDIDARISEMHRRDAEFARDLAACRTMDDLTDLKRSEQAKIADNPYLRLENANTVGIPT